MRSRTSALLLPLVVLCAVPVLLAQRGPGTGGVIWPPSPEPALGPIPEGVGRLSGRVLDRDLKAPIANVNVTIRLVPTGPQGGPANAGTIVATDRLGEFTVRGIGLGRYTLQAAALGYSPAHRLSMPSVSEIVTLTSAKADGAVTLSLSRTGGLAGKVTDATGAPMIGVPVRVLRTVVVSPRIVWQPIPAVALTDRDGGYRFTNAPAGDYITGVYYRSVAMPATVSAALWDPAAREAADALRARLAESSATVFSSPLSGGSIDVGGYRWSIFDALDRPILSTSALPGDAVHASSYGSAAAHLVTAADPITLDAGEFRDGVNIVVRKVKGVRVSGLLVGDPAQVAHVGLRLMPPDEDELYQTFPQELATTISDAQGRFSFFAVPPGPATIASVTAGLTSAPGTMPRRATTAWVRQRIDVGSADTAGLKVGIRPPLTLRGRIVLDASGPGAPVSRPPLSVLRLSAAATISQPPVINAGNDAGEFAFTQLVSGRYRLDVQPYATWVVRSVTVGGKETLNRYLDVGDRDIDNVVVTMSTSFNRVSGNVFDTSGAPIEGAQVVMFPADYREWMANGRPPGAVRTTASAMGGRFIANGLPDGEYLLVAFTSPVENDWQSPAALHAMAQAAQRVRLEGAQSITVQIRGALSEVPKK